MKLFNTSKIFFNFPEKKILKGRSPCTLFLNKLKYTVSYKFANNITVNAKKIFLLLECLGRVYAKVDTYQIVYSTLLSDVQIKDRNCLLLTLFLLFTIWKGYYTQESIRYAGKCLRQQGDEKKIKECYLSLFSWVGKKIGVLLQVFKGCTFFLRVLFKKKKQVININYDRNLIA